LLQYAEGGAYSTVPWPEEFIRSFRHFMPTTTVEVLRYNRSSIDPEFAAHNQRILSGRKAGYFLWKPYIIADALRRLDDGDVVIYFDTRYWFVNDAACLFEPLLEVDDIVSWRNKPNEDQYYLYRHAKPDTLAKYNWTRARLAFKVKEAWAGALIVRKSPRSVAMIEEWLEMCQGYHDISDERSRLPYPAHYLYTTWDQVLLTMALYHHNVTTHTLPTWEMQNQRRPWAWPHVPCHGLHPRVHQCFQAAGVPCNKTKWVVNDGDHCLLGRGIYGLCVEGLSPNEKPKQLRNVPVPHRNFSWEGQ